MRTNETRLKTMLADLDTLQSTLTDAARSARDGETNTDYLAAREAVLHARAILLNLRAHPHRLL